MTLLLPTLSSNGTEISFVLIHRPTISKGKRVKFHSHSSKCALDVIRIQADSFIFTADKTESQVRQIQQSGCQAALIPEDFFPAGFGIAMPKGSPYKPFFDHS